ncbi:hypothetical protein E8E12_009636 [Didymella heteroderae]|uniref:Uncharacterized protein n=1 Tax=Didymella heteroderae TaxID=1769908 RepID=A0A9P4WXY3_9PLEO|nr:hypothetical protein E8E12_009636 [Didymella heteroderae]
MAEQPSSSPPLIQDRSGSLEDGEIHEQPGAFDSLKGELQLSNFEYSDLEDRYKRLERQHSGLQDLASAYYEVISGVSATNAQGVSIDQLQAEAGREGLRAKALEADMLKPLVRETGGLQALISQTKAMKKLIDKAGGLRELEIFVTDLRTIRDTLDKLRGSRGLDSLAAEMRDLLQSKRKFDGLASEVDGPYGLRDKAAKYEKLSKAFADVQNTFTPQKPSASNAAMNPARARMIFSTPLETDPDRDLYEAPPPVAKPNNRTGSNNTPLGASQDQVPESSLKRKGPESSASSMPAKCPRFDVGHRVVRPMIPSGKRAGTAGIIAQTQAVSVHVSDSPLGQSNIRENGGQTSPLEARANANDDESRCAKTDTVGFGRHMQTAPAPPKMPDWMRTDVRFRNVGFASVAGASRHSSTPPAQDVEIHADARLRPVRLSTTGSTLAAFSSRKSGNFDEAQTALQAVAAVPADPRLNQMTIRKAYLRHTVALWVGSSDSSAAWGAHQLYGLKRDFQIPVDLLACLTGELSRLIPMSKYNEYEKMTPNQDTCILRQVRLSEHNSIY